MRITAQDASASPAQTLYCNWLDALVPRIATWNGPVIGPVRGAFREHSRSGRAYNRAVRDSKLLVVQSYGSRPEAELARGALEDAGIQSMIRADSVGGMREHLAWSGAGFEILVREEDAAAAHEVLTAPAEGSGNSDAGLSADSDAYPPWRRFT